MAPTVDIADRIVALQRRNAAASKPRERAARTPIPAKRRAPSPPSRQDQSIANDGQEMDPNPEDFDRRLNINSESHRPPSSRTHGKLHALPEGVLPVRRTAEPEAYSEDSSTDQPYPPRSRPPPSSRQREAQSGSSRQLFDYRKETPPVRFQPSTTTKPSAVNRSSGDTWVSASSTSNSSYAHSIGSSFTLTSNSTGTSGSSLSGLNQPKGSGEGSNAFVAQLKILYRDINSLEQRLIAEDTDFTSPEEPRYILQGRSAPAEEASEDKFVRLVRDHKKLADMMQNIMKTTLAPQVPTSVHTISTKYNIPTRLWGNAFHRVLEALRRASTSSPIALEHLTDMIFWAYSYYTALFEDPQLETFKNYWIEALGDLARYRMAIATFNPSPDFFGPSAKLPALEDKSLENDSPTPSIGIYAAQLLEVEPERDQWRGTARRWYAIGLSETPGNGRLHHHLGLLSRDADDEELRSVYHFAKSLTVLHTFPTSRESILPLFSVDAQRRRALPDSSTRDLFLLLHGMIFTHVQLDDFMPSMARFLERLALDNSIPADASSDQNRHLEERDWIMMGVLNIAAILEYGRPEAVLRGSGAITTKDPVVNIMKGNNGNGDANGMEVDDEEHSSTQAEPFAPNSIDTPLAFQYAIKMAFAVLRYTLRNPTRKPNPFARTSLNPYTDMILTFLAYCMKQPGLPDILEREIPWTDLVAFLNTAPSNAVLTEADLSMRITQGCTPLPEDWCMRGMEWAARRTYERGFWRADSGLGGEQSVLNLVEIGSDMTDGIIEDDDENDEGRRTEKGETSKRWTRAIRASVMISRAVSGFRWNKEHLRWRIDGTLAEKLARWQQEDHDAAETEKLHGDRKQKRMSMDIDSEDEMESDELSSSDESDDEESSQVKSLKARRHFLQSLLKAGKSGNRRHQKFVRNRQAPPRSTTETLSCRAGYTVLVVDTNVLLSALSEFKTLVAQQAWTIIVPLAVITELDGLSSNNNELGIAAGDAVHFISDHIRSHSISLKVQTSKSNYLSSLSIRIEDIQFNDEEASWERNMDDLVLKATMWQEEHWSDRSQLLKGGQSDAVSSGTAKVVLLTFDRNLRLKARARQLNAADHKGLNGILLAQQS